MITQFQIHHHFGIGHRCQTGAVLVVSLLMLLVMTMIGVTGVQVTSLEEKMAGNTRDRNLAFQSAEATLRAAESNIAAVVALNPATGQATGMGLGTFEALFGTTPGYYAVDTVPNNLLTGDAATWAGNTVLTYNATLASVSAPPKYVIEKLNLGTCSGGTQGHPFRITAYATGGTVNAVVILQSVYQIDVPC